MEIIKVKSLYHHAFCVYLRMIVFTQGQGVPVEMEIEPDEDEAVYFLGMYDEKPIATGRYRIVEEGEIGKIERLAVLDEARGKGYGLDLMEALVEDIKQNYPGLKIKVASQDHAIPFYKKAGFVIGGERFMGAGIPHHTMILKEVNI